MKHQIVSRHLLRRRARSLLKRLKDAQRTLQGSPDVYMGQREKAALGFLEAYGVQAADGLRVERASRGPWRWYVVAG